MNFDITNIRNLTIQKRFRQVPICDVDFYNVTPEQELLLIVGKSQNWFMNGFQQFAGVIKRVDKDDNKPIWHVHSEGAACILRDTILNIDKVYRDTLVTDIISSLIPSGWTVNYDIVSIRKLWYHITPGSALSHITNLTRLAGLEWDINQDFWYSGGVINYGNYILTISDHIGSTDITSNYVNNTNCYNLVLKQNQDKVYTSIQAVGSSPESARMTSLITADCPFTNFSTLTTTESYLTNSITAATTIIPVANTSWYFPPGLIAVDGEYMYTTSKTANNLTVTRGYLGLTPATTHATAADVLNLHEFRFSPDITFPNHAMIIGSEHMTFQNKASGRVYGTIGRNIKGITANATPGYAHHTGSPLRANFDTTYGIPSPTSYASLNGIRQVTIDAMGSIDQDGVDLKAGLTVLKTATSAPYGSMYLTSTDVWKEVTLGDGITVTQAATWIDSVTDFASHLQDGTVHVLHDVPCKIKAETVTIDTRIIGITWNQYKPLFIEYGDVDMFILDDFANAAKAYNTAINRNANTTYATVYAVDPNDPNSLQIPINGVLTWCKKA